MASLSELANVLQTSPAGAFRQEDTAYQQYQLQNQALQQAKQDMAPQQPLAGMAGGAGGQPQALGQMAGSVLSPDYKLTTPDGELTTSGLYNKTMSTAQTESQQAQRALKDANYLKAMGKTAEAQQAEQEARRLQTKSQETLQNAQKQKKEAKDDFASTLYGAKSQVDYDNRLKDVLSRTGIEPPKDFPTTWSPDMKEKLLSKMSPEMRAKIEKEDREIAKEKRAEEDQRFQRNREAARDKELTGILGAITGKEYADVKGQVEGLRAFLPDDRIKRLSGKEIPKVSSTIQSVVQTNELADLVEKHPLSAGVPSQIINSFEKYLPSRYEKDEEGGANQSKILSDVEKTMKSKGASPDEIDYSRLIAKKVLDVVNARALAASGGGRLLISELNRQSEVLKSSGLTPSSAPFVYRELAQGDLTALESKYGIKPEEFKGLGEKKSEAPKSPETKPAQTKPTVQEGQTSTSKSGRPIAFQGGQWVYTDGAK